MNKKLIPRALEKTIEKSISYNLVTAFIGARQVGKSTLAKIITKLTLLKNCLATQFIEPLEK